MNRSNGRLFIISAPSGTGKSTVISEIMKIRGNIFFSVSATTRQQRAGEENGVNYWFISREEFEKMTENDEFLEHAEYVGNCYGTPIKPIVEHLQSGTDVILDIEVQGFKQIKEKMPDAVSIFIVPPSLEVLEQRLRGRGTDSEEKIKGRLEKASQEMKMVEFYDYVVTNNSVEETAKEIVSIMDAE